MLKKYADMIAPAEELKIGPSPVVMQSILNYSKSVEVKKIKQKKVILVLN